MSRREQKKKFEKSQIYKTIADIALLLISLIQEMLRGHKFHATAVHIGLI